MKIFRNYKEFINNRKKYKGFTLIELLVILLILFLIFSIVVFSFKDVFGNAKATISKAEENIILSAANDYALEYRGTDSWVEEVNNDGTINFCVSLDSLINYGYFKNDGSNFEKYKNEWVVEFQIKNGVTNYKFIEFSESETCKFVDFSSTIGNSNINTEIKDDKGNSIGEFNYEVNRIGDKKYSFDFDMSMDLITMIRDIYVTLVIDKSGSMNGSKFTNAKEAAKSFSQTLISSDKADAQIALIMYDGKAELKRNFEHAELTDSIFGNIGNNTNIGAGLDMAISLMCNKGLDIDPSDSEWCSKISDVPIDNSKTKKLYTILFFDGQMNSYPSSNGLNVNDLNTNDKRKKYYDNFLNSHSSNGVSGNSYSFNRYVLPSINYLKNDLDVNLFMIGYEFDPSIDGMKISPSSGDKLCVGGYSHGGKNYCYYDASSSTINSVLNTILDNIVNDSGISKLKITFSSVKTDDGQDLITILKPNDSMIENNKLIIEIDDLNNRTEDFENSLRGYKFILNDSVYNYCSFDDSDECNISANLFNFSIEVEYVNGEKINNSLESPKFDLILTDRKTIN